MAKSLNFFGQKSGSTKSLTFQIRDGKQIVKDRVSNVRNPRSERQMAQRCRMATVAQAYRYMRSILNHSFQGMSGKAQNYARFSKLALNAMKADMSKFAYAEWAVKEFNPGQYQMSEGSLDPIANYEMALSDGKLLVKSPVLGGTATEAEICNALGLQKLGDMITICVVVPSEITSYAFAWVRAKLISNPSTSALAVNTQLSCVRFDSSEGVAYSGFKFTATEAHIHIEISTIPLGYLTPGAEYCGNAVIRSREENDGWKYSPAILQMGSGFAAATVDDFENAVATYPTGETFVLQGGGESVQ